MRYLIYLAQLDTGSLPRVGANGNGNAIQVILDIVFAFAGAIAVFMIVYGGFRFVISRGNPDATTKARETIIYSVVGLVIVLLGFGIVNFVLGRL